MLDNKSNIYKILGNNIKRIRSLEGISQENLAERIGKSSHYISVLERGESGLSVSTLIDICKVLHTDTNSIFNGIIDDSPSNSFLNKSIEHFNEKDKEMVLYLVQYILNSKK